MSRFKQLMQRGQPKVRYRERQAKLLMTMSDEQHKAIAKLLQHWLKDDEQPVTAVKRADRK
ncbi:hypothetical protein [Alteromonas gilva]|uniref:Uncharacterized protein n=1 Tax=Alteromonas gilva TaxID=2987522 RepID=A0ABT5L379_9ALTE|nr:hypothetical protein [Alteromonas gilva]MDC8830856.1 hypothetical protein [Alteromonas gilva]